jgi:hypothetical protein
MAGGTAEASLQSIAVEDERDGLIAMKWIVTNHSGRPLNGRPYYISEPGATAPAFAPPVVIQTETGETKLNDTTFTVPPEWPTTITLRVRVAKGWSGRVTPRFMWDDVPQVLAGGRRYSLKWDGGRLTVSLDL